MSCGILRLLGCWIILEQMCLGLRSCAGTVTPVPWVAWAFASLATRAETHSQEDAQGGVLLNVPLEMTPIQTQRATEYPLSGGVLERRKASFQVRCTPITVRRGTPISEKPCMPLATDNLPSVDSMHYSFTDKEKVSNSLRN